MTKIKLYDTHANEKMVILYSIVLKLVIVVFGLNCETRPNI